MSRQAPFGAGVELALPRCRMYAWMVAPPIHGAWASQQKDTTGAVEPLIPRERAPRLSNRNAAGSPVFVEAVSLKRNRGFDLLGELPIVVCLSFSRWVIHNRFQQSLLVEVMTVLPCYAPASASSMASPAWTVAPASFEMVRGRRCSGDPG